MYKECEKCSSANICNAEVEPGSIRCRINRPDSEQTQRQKSEPIRYCPESLMDNKDVILVGTDIYEFVKDLCNQFLKESPDMSEGERKAYKLGINNTLLLLNQALNKSMVGPNSVDDADAYIAVHIPRLRMVEEFCSVEEIIKLIRAN